MRGKVVVIEVAVALVGITPAHAGKRSDEMVLISLKEDHPRPCGEKFRRPYHSTIH